MPAGSGKMMSTEEFAGSGPTFDFGQRSGKREAMRKFAEARAKVQQGAQPTNVVQDELASMARAGDREVRRVGNHEFFVYATRLATENIDSKADPRFTLEDFPFPNVITIKLDPIAGTMTMGLQIVAPNSQRYASEQMFTMRTLTSIPEAQVAQHFIETFERLVTVVMREWARTCIRINGVQVFKPDDDDDMPDPFAAANAMPPPMPEKSKADLDREAMREFMRQEDEEKARREHSKQAAADALRSGGMDELAKRFGR